MKELTLLIGTCISCCMSAGFTNTNLQPIFENDMVRMNVQLNTLDGNQDGICDYQDGHYFCLDKDHKNCIFYEDDDQNGICDHCQRKESSANVSRAQKHVKHRRLTFNLLI